jgi:hypothetical protein
MLLSLICLSAFGSQEIMRTNKGFFVKEAGIKHRVDLGLVDKNLRALSAAQITALSKRNLIKITKCADGAYVLREQGKLKGAGPGGATAGAYIGKFVVHFIGHGTIAIISACTGPAAAVTAASLEATFLPAIEAASNVGAIAGGIIGGVATGPV